jgi:hypothetical protein
MALDVMVEVDAGPRYAPRASFRLPAIRMSDCDWTRMVPREATCTLQKVYVPPGRMTPPGIGCEVTGSRPPWMRRLP